MQILLDTHIYLWWLNEEKKIPLKMRHLIEDAEIVYVSTVSMWEIAIKIQIGKLNTNLELLINEISAAGFQELPLLNEHIKTLTSLPHHHKDPFDRMLLAQTITEPLQFITADNTLKKYSELVTTC